MPSAAPLLLLLLALPPFVPPALARTFYATSNTFLPDANPGDGVCRTIWNTCTLRAAIDESNALPTLDRIVVSPGTFRTDSSALGSGLALRERVKIEGKGASKTTFSGNGRERHFEVLNEKLIMGLRDGEVGAYRPSSGRRLGALARIGGGVSSAGAFYFTSDYMYTTYFITGVARYKLRTREAIQASSDKSTYAFDRVVIDGNGNGAGLTAPTAIARAGNGDILINNYQPTGYAIRRYDATTFAFRGNFLSAPALPGIVNSMAVSAGRVYVTLVSDRQVRAYDHNSAALLATSTTSLSLPRGIVVCSRRVFVADETSHRVVELDEDLRYVRTLVADAGRLETPQGLACFAGTGDLFIKTKNRKLLHYRYTDTDSTYVRDLSIASNFVAGIAAISGKDYYGGPGVTIAKATLRDGRVSTGSSGPSVRVARGCWTRILRCTLRGNEGSTFGGAVTNSGTAIISRSRLIDNTMPSWSLSGGGVTNSGGAIGNFGKLRVEYSEISGNKAARGGGIWSSGSQGYVTVFQSTISGNFAGNAGGGIYNTRFVELIYATVTANECGQFSGDPASRRAGCGFYSYRNPATPNSYVSISSSLIADNKQLGNTGTHAPDCLAETSFSVRSLGGNILGSVDAAACKRFGRTADDTVGSKTAPVDPRLDTLRFLKIGTKNAVTRAHEPMAGSLPTTFNPFGAGGNPTHRCPAKDQIGRARPRGSVCDVGAIER